MKRKSEYSSAISLSILLLYCLVYNCFVSSYLLSCAANKNKNKTKTRCKIQLPCSGSIPPMEAVSIKIDHHLDLNTSFVFIIIWTPPAHTPWRMMNTRRRGAGMSAVWSGRRRKSCWRDGGMAPSWSGTARLKGAPLPALLCKPPDYLQVLSIIADGAGDSKCLLFCGAVWTGMWSTAWSTGRRQGTALPSPTTCTPRWGNWSFTTATHPWSNTTSSWM